MPQFPSPHPVSTEVRVPAGIVEIYADDRDTVDVQVTPADGGAASREAAEATWIDLAGDQLRIVLDPVDGRWSRRSGQVRVVALVPAGGPLHVSVASADVRCAGRYADARIDSASGDLYIEEVAGDLSVKTASGRLLAERVDGAARVRSASGDISLGTVGGEISVHSASGHVEIGDAAGSASATTASGAVRIASAHSGTIQARSASGAINVGVSAGTGVWLDLNTLSGRTHTDLAMSGGPGGSATLRLELRSMSGDIRVFRATPTDQAPQTTSDPADSGPSQGDAR